MKSPVAIAWVLFALWGCATPRAHLGTSAPPLEGRVQVNDARCVSENPLGAFEQWADDAAIDVMKGRVGAAFARVGLRENRPGLVVRVEVLDWWVVFVSNVSFERSAIVRARLRATTGGPWMTAEATEALSVSIARFEARAVAELFGDALTRAADRLAVELASEHP